MESMKEACLPSVGWTGMDRWLRNMLRLLQFHFRDALAPLLVGLIGGIGGLHKTLTLALRLIHTSFILD